MLQWGLEWVSLIAQTLHLIRKEAAWSIQQKTFIITSAILTLDNCMYLLFLIQLMFVRIIHFGFFSRGIRDFWGVFNLFEGIQVVDCVFVLWGVSQISSFVSLCMYWWCFGSLYRNNLLRRPDGRGCECIAVRVVGKIGHVSVDIVCSRQVFS